MTSFIGENVEFKGDVTVLGKLYPPDGSLANKHFSDSSTNRLSSGKVVHRHTMRHFAAGTVATATIPLHIAYASGALVRVQVACITAPEGGDLAFTVDLQKGNQSTAFASVLSSPISYGDAQEDREVEAATPTTAAFAADDEFQLVIATSGSTGTQGSDLLVVVHYEENPS